MVDFWEPETRGLDWVKIWEARSNSWGLLSSGAFGKPDILLLPPDLMAFSLLSPGVLFIRELWERDGVWEFRVGDRDFFEASGFLDADKCPGNPASSKGLLRGMLCSAAFRDILLWPPDLSNWVFPLLSSRLRFICEDRDLSLCEGGLQLK